MEKEFLLQQRVPVVLSLGTLLRLAREEERDGESAAEVMRRFADLPVIGEKHEGGLYAGLTLENERPAKLILPPDEFEGNWKNSDVWAKDHGAVLPSRFDQLVLLKNLKSEFKEGYYWSAEEYAPYPDYAWGQFFADGDQYYGLKDSSWRARAVRRVVLK